MEPPATTHAPGPPRWRRRNTAVFAIALLSACAAHPAKTVPGRHAAATRQIALALGETSVGGTPRTQPLPAYPAALLPSQLPPRTLQARLAVDAQGAVVNVQVRGEDGADAAQPLFAEAVRKAVLGWTFEPLRVHRWAADAEGDAHAVDDAARPFMVDCVFSFAWQDGRPTVTALAVGRAR